MSPEERINRLEERVAELLIAQATLNDRYDDIISRVLELESSNEQLLQRISRLVAYLDIQPEQLDSQADQFGMAIWLQQTLKRRVN